MRRWRRRGCRLINFGRASRRRHSYIFRQENETYQGANSLNTIICLWNVTSDLGDFFWMVHDGLYRSKAAGLSRQSS